MKTEKESTSSIIPQYDLLKFILKEVNIDGLVQDCSIYIADALEILQSCTFHFISLMHYFPLPHVLCDYVK